MPAIFEAEDQPIPIDVLLAQDAGQHLSLHVAGRRHRFSETDGTVQRFIMIIGNAAASTDFDCPAFAQAGPAESPAARAAWSFRLEIK